MRELNKVCTPNDFGFYLVRAYSIYNSIDKDHYALYTHNVRKKLEEYGGKLYAPFVFRGKLVVLKGDRLYPD